MATRGFLIRFIDIGLIVLFGFLMISEIEMSSRVELAGAGGDDAEAVLEPTGRVYVSVEITPEGRFVVSERPADETVPVARTEDGAAVAEAPLDEAGERIEPADTSGETVSAPADSPEAEAGVLLPPDVTEAPTVVDDIGALTDELRTRSARHAEELLETIVLIEPSPGSVVQHTVNVMDVCDRLGLTKSLRMDIEVEAVSDAGPREGQGPS